MVHVYQRSVEFFLSRPELVALVPLAADFPGPEATRHLRAAAARLVDPSDRLGLVALAHARGLPQAEIESIIPTSEVCMSDQYPELLSVIAARSEALGEARGVALGEARGVARARREAVSTWLSARFPGEHWSEAELAALCVVPLAELYAAPSAAETRVRARPAS